jgi:hypothetical protein
MESAGSDCWLFGPGKTWIQSRGIIYSRAYLSDDVKSCPSSSVDSPFNGRFQSRYDFASTVKYPIREPQLAKMFNNRESR